MPDPSPDRSRGLARSAAVTVAGSVGVLALNMASGILTARLLSADGRGEFGAIQGWALTAAILGGLGFREAATLFIARSPERAPRVHTTTAVITIVLGALTAIVAALLVPLGFRAQPPELVQLAQIFMIWVVPYLAYHTIASLLAGHRDHRALTVVRLAEPLMFNIGLVILWQSGQVSVVNVLVAHVTAFVIADLWGLTRIGKNGGWGRIEVPMIREGMVFGVKVHGNALGTIANTRLDLVLLPAFVAADDIGRYVVAVSAGSVIVPLFGYLSLVVFPEAASRRLEDALPLIEQSTRLVIVGSLLLALPLWILAPQLLAFVYGPEFEAAAGPLRLLLPGLVLWSATSITTSGLKATGRPGSSSIAQLVGMAITIVGLVIALPRWGILGAAGVSSIAYTTVFVIGIVVLGRHPAFSARRVARITAVPNDLRRLWAKRNDP